MDFKKGSLQWLRNILSRSKDMEMIGKKNQKELNFKHRCLKEAW